MDQQQQETQRPSSTVCIPVLVGPLVKTRQEKPCSIYFEITFLEERGQAAAAAPMPLSGIVFRNFYCSHISVKQKQPSGGGGLGGQGQGEEWATVLHDRPLMENPHYEGDAQDWHVLRAVEFDSDTYDPRSRSPLRVHLHQASPVWAAMELRHVKCVSCPPPPPPSPSPSFDADAASGGGHRSPNPRGLLPVSDGDGGRRDAGPGRAHAAPHW